MKAILLAWLGLIAGFGVTLGLAFVPLGPWHILPAMLIAAAQMFIVMFWLMHLRSSSRLTWFFAAGGIYWLGILFVLGLSDYLSRGWLK